jgi:hypothetical protein
MNEILDEKNNKLFIQKVKLDLEKPLNRIKTVQIPNEDSNNKVKHVNYDFSEYKNIETKTKF